MRKIVSLFTAIKNNSEIKPCGTIHTVHPSNQPSFDEWVNEFRVGSNHGRHGDWIDEGIVLTKQ